MGMADVRLLSERIWHGSSMAAQPLHAGNAAQHVQFGMTAAPVGDFKAIMANPRPELMQIQQGTSSGVVLASMEPQRVWSLPVPAGGMHVQNGSVVPAHQPVQVHGLSQDILASVAAAQRRVQLPPGLSSRGRSLVIAGAAMILQQDGKH